MPGEKCGGRVARALLMSGGVIGLDELAGDEGVIGVCAAKVDLEISSRDESVEHRRTGDRSIDGEAACLPLE